MEYNMDEMRRENLRKQREMETVQREKVRSQEDIERDRDDTKDGGFLYYLPEDSTYEISNISQMANADGTEDFYKVAKIYKGIAKPADAIEDENDDDAYSYTVFVHPRPNNSKDDGFLFKTVRRNTSEKQAKIREGVFLGKTSELEKLVELELTGLKHEREILQQA